MKMKDMLHVYDSVDLGFLIIKYGYLFEMNVELSYPQVCHFSVLFCAFSFQLHRLSQNLSAEVWKWG